MGRLGAPYCYAFVVVYGGCENNMMSLVLYFFFVRSGFQKFAIIVRAWKVGLEDLRVWGMTVMTST